MFISIPFQRADIPVTTWSLKFLLSPLLNTAYIFWQIHKMTTVMDWASFNPDKTVLKKSVFLWLSYRLHFWISGHLLLSPIWKTYVNANQSQHPGSCLLDLLIFLELLEQKWKINRFKMNGYKFFKKKRATVFKVILHIDIQIVLRWTCNWFLANINDTMKEYLWIVILESI